MLEGGGKSGHIACNRFLGVNTLALLVTVSYRAGCDADMSMCLWQQCAYACLVIGLLLLLLLPFNTESVSTQYALCYVMQTLNCDVHHQLVSVCMC